MIERDPKVEAFLLEEGPDGRETIGDWLADLVHDRMHGRNTNGKRPFGESDWFWFLREAMVKHHLTPKEIHDHVHAVLVNSTFQRAIRDEANRDD